ncbi:centrosomal protein of 152 kDa [Alosa pseudoharengus]|uniref:centrosomal protein of 152 kDa n=1 Tax=Alosa pseudoharengus TaxID=34774 RepID=UPI003F8BF545
MSIDFDSNALQTQHEEEEYDPEDYAREQELHKLLTDLPDDMLEDSRDSSPELNDSPCSNHGNGNRPQHAWNGQTEWTNQRPPALTEENYEDEGSYHQDYSYENGPGPLGQGGVQGYPYSSTGPEESSCTNDFSIDKGYEQEPYSPTKHPNDQQNYNQYRNHFQNVDNGGTAEKMPNHHKATFQPRQPSQMFNPEGHQNGHLPNGHLPNGHLPNGHLQNGHLEQLQRDFLDSRQNTLEGQQLAQLQVLHQAQNRQLEELERKMEDSKRSIRFLEHQLAIVKDEKEGLAVSLKESSRVLEETQSREAQLQASVTALERQIHTLTERDQESQKKLCVAEAAVDSMQQQMMEMCRSDTLTRVREQHDRDTHAFREQHEARVLSLQQMLDSHTHALQEQTELGQRLREQVRQLERQREEEQVERASVINALTQRLEDSQKQCAKLLHTGSVQEMSQMQMRLQQAQSAKSMSEEMNKALQEELSELKDQIRLYESAVKLRVVSLDSGGDWDNQLSDSYAELGIKKVNWKNTRMHSTPAQGEGVEPSEVVRELRAELQRCLASLKDKRQRISDLQHDLHVTQEQLQQHSAHTHSSTSTSPKGDGSLQKPAGAAAAAASSSDLTLLQEERQNLQDRVEVLERRNVELKQSEEKVKAANSELCSKMREMIQELDQEKQEAEERYERTQQQFRDDVVKRVSSELTQGHQAQMEELRTQHQQQTQALESKLCELQGEMAAVQECYISICKEKDRLEEEESKRQQASERAVEQLRAELQSEHQGELSRLRSQWEAEQQEHLQSNLASAQQSWQQQQQEVEQAWSVRLERAVEEERRRRAAVTQEGGCQTEACGVPAPAVPREEVQEQLQEQRERLQREAQEEQVAAVEAAVRRAQRELQQKHLKEVAKHVEGAVSRAHSRWLEELPTQPEYKARLQAEKSQWEQHTQTQISAAVEAAKDQWEEAAQADRAELEQSKERIGQLQEEVRSLQEEVRSLGEQQEALLGAELAAARASWTRRQQEETGRLQNQHQTQLEQDLQRAREEAQQEVKEGLQEALQLLRREGERTEEKSDCKRGGLRELCREALARAVAIARQDWSKRSEEKLRHVLKEMQERHQKEILQLQNSSAEGSDVPCVSKRCSETASRLQKKTQELQRQLEKACRQLQQTTRDHRTTLHTLTEEHEEVLRQEREAHAKAVEEAKRSAQEEGHGGQKSLQAGLEEMKEQYTGAVEKIRGDMLRYLQESKERAAELIRGEVQRERQETARRMRRYYLTCLQELLHDGGHANGAAEKKIINAASKLAAMAKVLETPMNKKKLVKSQTAQEEANLISVPGQTPRVPSGLAPTSALGDPVGVRPQALTCVREASESSGQSNACAISAPESSSLPRGLGDRTASESRGAPREQPRGLRGPMPPQLKPPASQKPPMSAAPPSSTASHGGRQRADASRAHVTLRSQHREREREMEPPQQRPRRSDSDPGRPTDLQAHSHLHQEAHLHLHQEAHSHLHQESSFAQEPPVRDGGQSEWSIASAGSYLPPHTHTLSSSAGSYQPAHTHSHTHALTLSSSAGSYLPQRTHTPVADLFGPLSALGTEFDACGSFLGDATDSTIYRQIVKATSGLPEGSGRLAPKSLFSELKGPQQDSGFSSPPSQLRKRPA